MVKKKTTKKKKKVVKITKQDKVDYPTLTIANDRDIAMDFATKAYKTFDQMIKSIVLFGSASEERKSVDSDIDIILIVDDVSVLWDAELIAYYREELAKLVQRNPYKRALHLNTIKLSTWWQDLMRGDPVLINVLRKGSVLIDHGGFFIPLKVLLEQGKIRATPEAVYTLLQRAPTHLTRARTSMLAVVDGLYWGMVDSAHALLISSNILPPSPEHIAQILKERFVSKKLLDKKHVMNYERLRTIAKEIIHGKRTEISGKEIDQWKSVTEDFMSAMARLVDRIVNQRKD